MKSVYKDSFRTVICRAVAGSGGGGGGVAMSEKNTPLHIGLTQSTTCAVGKLLALISFNKITIQIKC
jgi:hypothetical protein